MVEAGGIDFEDWNSLVGSITYLLTTNIQRYGKKTQTPDRPKDPQTDRPADRRKTDRL